MRIGIDIDTWKLTFCGLTKDAVKFEQIDIRERGQVLFDAVQRVPGALSLAVARLMYGVEQGEWLIESVYVERGRGQFRTADFELGAIYGAVVVGAKQAIPGAHLRSVSVQEWKKMVTAHVGVYTAAGYAGNGNASKAEANAACREILQRPGIGMTTTVAGALSPDHLDAFGIVWSQGQDLPPKRPKAQGALPV